ncbi:MAG: hypothetical protein HC849_03915 [Oscillatoriales cyanobacterium RU_3_3]|nr:hypothetical protein [Microcoleus sp. SU_5_6]NJM59519.1 hypothetical protein [Oscillatoriales cyanobacterium RU_3_3]NJR23549.1 hypothetical protein [Richelia sp. CSU_2_1]
MGRLAVSSDAPYNYNYQPNDYASGQAINCQLSTVNSQLSTIPDILDF